jgi:hypothetical protein
LIERRGLLEPRRTVVLEGSPGLAHPALVAGSLRRSERSESRCVGRLLGSLRGTLGNGHDFLGCFGSFRLVSGIEGFPGEALRKFGGLNGGAPSINQVGRFWFVGHVGKRDRRNNARATDSPGASVPTNYQERILSRIMERLCFSRGP